MTLFGVIFVLEIWPMVTLIRWQRGFRKEALDTSQASRLALISYTQANLIILMV